MDVGQTLKDMMKEVRTAEPVSATARGLKGFQLLAALFNNPRAVAFILAASFLTGLLGMYVVIRLLNIFR